MAGLDEVESHWPAHVAQSNESDTHFALHRAKSCGQCPNTEVFSPLKHPRPSDRKQPNSANLAKVPRARMFKTSQLQSRKNLISLLEFESPPKADRMVGLTRGTACISVSVQNFTTLSRAAEGLAR